MATARRTLAGLLVSGWLLTGLCAAAPVVYTFHGTGSGTVDTVSFSNVAFTVTLVSDTSQITTGGWVVRTPDVAGASINISGFGTGTFTNTQVVFEDQNNGVIEFTGNVGGTILQGSSPIFRSYNLQYALGPVALANPFWGLFKNVPTSLGKVTLSSVSNVTFSAGCTLAPYNPVSVVTYHNDNHRSGWNDHESTLTWANVASPSFGQLFNIALDDQVDVQPLILPAVNVTVGSFQGYHNVVYVATESNTIYMIDAVNGLVLFSKNFGPPVPKPLGCQNNGPNVGIDGTPVIDEKTMTMYVVTYTLESGQFVYRLHALNVSSLADKIPNRVVSASHLLSNGTTLKFDARLQRQRPGMLAANGNIHVGFGSFCDSDGRGWILGWNAATLTPLAANQLNDTQSSTFLSAIWMSGYGIAADDSGNLYFVTGNSIPGSYDGVTNIQESAVKVSSDLTKVLSLFTPSDVADLDTHDTDFGSGGVLLLPKQPSASVSMGAAAGKDGRLFLLDLNNLGGKSATGIGGTRPFSVGGCWCGQSSFSDGTVHMVSSGGTNLILWKVQPSPPSLVQQATSPSIGNGQDPGFFTSVSSNGTSPLSDPIIWAVSRPNSPGTAGSPGPIGLWAFKGQPTGTNLPQLFHGTAGGWFTPDNNANANIVPVVANGRVFVASYKQLRIFGLH